jgi:hypothetical protein
MEKYFYKLTENIDFVWKINIHVHDPYKQDELDFGHYVCNQRVFNPHIFDSLADFQQRESVSAYREIEPDSVNDENCYFDRSVGLLHTDDYWTNLHAHRNVPCLGKITPIVFGGSKGTIEITNNDRERYLKLMSCGPEVGQAIYHVAHDYFSSLWEFDTHFAETNLDTLEKFLPTLELQAIYLRRENESKSENESESGKEDVSDTACVVFRPSWDPEHGLAVLINLDSKEVTLYED